MTVAVLGSALLLLAAPAAPVEVRFVTLAQCSASGLRQPLRTVVRTAAQWAALWKEHGGTVEFASTPGQGTVFRVCLPLAVRSEERERISDACLVGGPSP